MNSDPLSEWCSQIYTLMNLPNRTGILLTKQKIQNYVNISISKFSLCFFIQNFRTF